MSLASNLSQIFKVLVSSMFEIRYSTTGTAGKALLSWPVSNHLDLGPQPPLLFVSGYSFHLLLSDSVCVHSQHAHRSLSHYHVKKPEGDNPCKIELLQTLRFDHRQPPAYQLGSFHLVSVFLSHASVFGAIVCCGADP